MRKSTNCAGNTIRRAALERAKADAVSYIRNYGRLPSCVWLDAWRLSLGDFTATLAGDDGVSREIPVRKGNLDSERYITSDPVKPWKWPIVSGRVAWPSSSPTTGEEPWVTQAAIGV